MLGDVRKGLGDDEVRGSLHRIREPLAGWQRTRDDRRDRAAPGDRAQGGHEAAVHQDRRRDPAHEVAQLGKRQARLLPGVDDEHAGRGWIVVDPIGGQAQVDRQHDEALLGPVVEVALDPSQLGRLDIEHRPAAPLERLDPALQRPLLRVAQQPGDDRAVEPHQALRCRRGDRGHGQPGEPAHDRGRKRDGRQAARPGSQVGHHVPDRYREERHGDPPQDHRRDELEDREGKRDAHVHDVAPAVEVRELGQQQVADAGAEWPVCVRLEGPRVGQLRPPPLGPGDQAATFDGHPDRHDADPEERRGRAERQAGCHQGEREDLHPEPERDRERRVPGGRVERRQKEGADRAAAPPRDLSAQEGAQDQEQAEDGERRADHEVGEPRRIEPATRTSPKASRIAGPNQATLARPGNTAWARAIDPKTTSRMPR